MATVEAVMSAFRGNVDAHGGGALFLLLTRNGLKTSRFNGLLILYCLSLNEVVSIELMRTRRASEIAQKAEFGF